jgi:hypothetical protein
MEEGEKEPWVPLGRFAWKSGWRAQPEAAEAVEREALAAGEEWLAIKAGFFRSVEHFKKVATEVAARLGRNRNR